MLNHLNDYFTVLSHYLFYLILVGLLSFGLTYVMSEQKDGSLKTRMNQNDRLILKEAENYRLSLFPLSLS